LEAFDLAAETEITDFESSETRRALDRLDEFLEALSRLRRAASAPKVEEFSLDEIVQRCIQDSSVPQNVQIQRSGPQPCVAEGDSGLISLSLANGLRNSVEATVAASKESARLPVIVTWGTTDVEYWISVVDNGIGFKGDVHRAFDVGTSTKAGHLGMGLAIASQALTSMGGRIFLIPNERGVRFEMRWPKAAGEVDASSSR
jgi:signal transduction histidine kinase